MNCSNCNIFMIRKKKSGLCRKCYNLFHNRKTKKKMLENHKCLCCGKKVKPIKCPCCNFVLKYPIKCESCAEKNRNYQMRYTTITIQKLNELTNEARV